MIFISTVLSLKMIEGVFKSEEVKFSAYPLSEEQVANLLSSAFLNNEEVFISYKSVKRIADSLNFFNLKFPYLSKVKITNECQVKEGDKILLVLLDTEKDRPLFRFVSVHIHEIVKNNEDGDHNGNGKF